jgi:transketolase
MARGQGYVGQGLQLADILACVFGSFLRRLSSGEFYDRFVLSTGHSAIGVYAALGELGFYDVDQLGSYGMDGSPIEESPLEGQPGFAVTGGSLGQGLSQAVGFALAARIRREGRRTVCIISDGELQEGQTWEAVMSAAHHKVGSLIALVDANGEQADGSTAETMAVEPIVAKFQAFDWHVCRVDGHDTSMILEALAAAVDSSRPSALVCDTVSAYGSPSLIALGRPHYVRAESDVWRRALEEVSE